jgi:hypothetical protein
MVDSAGKCKNDWTLFSKDDFSQYPEGGHLVHYIRSVDDRNIPNGEYELVMMASGSASEYILLEKMHDVWKILRY